MILNDLELQSSLKAASELQEALDSFKDDGDWLNAIQKESMRHQLQDLNYDIKLYGDLQHGNFKTKNHLKLAELPNYLICARISKNITQDQVAAYLNIQPEEFTKIEASQYAGVSLSRIINVSHYLNLDIKKIVNSDGKTVFEENEDDLIDWSALPINEMQKRGWIDKGTNTLESAKQFIKGSFGFGLQPALNRKTSFTGKTSKKASLLAWQAQVLSSANKIIRSKEIPSFELNDSWIPELVQLSKHENGPVLATELLERKGIIWIYEPHLEGTYLDGGAMLAENGTPIIGMTLRHDRIDNFWFVLLHELGHVFLHLSNIGNEFVDEKVGEDQDGEDLEDEADLFALDSLIPPDLWKTAVSRVMPTNTAIEGDANKMGIHPAIIAGRWRKEKDNYRKFSDLVGYGKVREMF
ncbi:ImmA/IrrE family metallo-endopeptidase [Vibrio parahaemolyticus]|uniref:ImmA/IrrE family metallo-endopeptidase n=1 Tax=Vibrio parahaemolyticus TaxID=670 RepID=UPI0003A0212D|nr:ImmA/IrrE family metallo-endopeptidase [Vibrio parahaemolyticus]EGR1188847.1 ImmA/IrrE family metallo-endopeptidase [Vibrio parahaemolyticus]EGR1233621.1 ImmA/IrrE family metallo-endopeptidase [Vibrio parahaemolyticus]EIN4364655.1 ImmA/IrrE family metallo-endopeptidase [Vibrio parahaemolyticus]EJB8502183.1 ImmA/IrrE family metallo-endopeptidase [Vibrio parahaemolyticus]ELJ8873683.1 ImmA/IrrE family metallo-endopeptidase [Vibrio parahaemolyticus]